MGRRWARWWARGWSINSGEGSCAERQEGAEGGPAGSKSREQKAETGGSSTPGWGPEGCGWPGCRSLPGPFSGSVSAASPRMGSASSAPHRGDSHRSEARVAFPRSGARAALGAPPVLWAAALRMKHVGGTWPAPPLPSPRLAGGSAKVVVSSEPAPLFPGRRFSVCKDDRLGASWAPGCRALPGLPGPAASFHCPLGAARSGVFSGPLSPHTVGLVLKARPPACGRTCKRRGLGGTRSLGP